MIKLLIMTNSAGIDPWKAIEVAGQAQTFASTNDTNVRFVWVEANSSLDGMYRYALLNKLLQRRFDRVRRPANGLERSWHVDKCFSHLIRQMVGLVVTSRMPKATPENAERITLPVASHYYLQTIRTLAAIQFVAQNYEFDYLLRISSTCYVDVPHLLRILGDRGLKTTYAGDVYKKRGLQFVGGAGILMSRDVVTGIALQEKYMRFDVQEDVAIGAIIRDLGLAVPESMPRVDVRGISLGEEIPRSRQVWVPFLYRCKVEHPWTTQSSPVIALMQDTHSYLTSRPLG